MTNVLERLKIEDVREHVWTDSVSTHPNILSDGWESRSGSLAPH